MKFSHISFVVLSVVLLASCGSSQEAPGTPVAPVETSTGTSTGAKAAAFPQSVQSIIQAQLKDPDSIMKLDCNTYDEAGKKYCNDEKAKMTALKSEVTWESILKKGPKFIKTFDCKKIASSVGQKFCTDYQANPANK